VGGQKLQIRRGDCDPVTVMSVNGPAEQDDPGRLCELVATNRAGFGSVIAGVFQRLGVTPDGSGVVFEVNNHSQLIFPRTPLADEQQGFFYVRADGSGLRRLGPPSGYPAFRITSNFDAIYQTYLPFSPSGRLVAYTDVDGNGAPQIYTLDLVTEQLTQVTRLSPSPSSQFGEFFSVSGQVFLDEHTIQFLVEPEDTINTIRTDGTGSLSAAPLLPESLESVATKAGPAKIAVAQPVGRVIDLGLRAQQAENASQCNYQHPVETFRIVGRSFFQLTNFGRCDTSSISPGWLNGPFVGKGRVLLTASKPSSANPFENCQLFSIGPWAGGLRQLTNFNEGKCALYGCSWYQSPGCGITDAYQDTVTNWIVFYSSCHPFDPNFVGSAVFAMRPDGGRLRQVTRTAGVHHFGNEVDVEIPGPIAYSIPIR
jgi:hypothetical protein